LRNSFFSFFIPVIKMSCKTINHMLQFVHIKIGQNSYEPSDCPTCLSTNISEFGGVSAADFNFDETEYEREVMLMIVKISDFILL